MAFRSPGEELKVLREGVGLVDLTGWGILRLRGRDRLDFVQRMSTNDVRGLTSGQGAPTVFLTPIGRIVDLALVLVREEALSLVVGRGAAEAVTNWLRRHIFFNDDVIVEDLTPEWSAMGLLGPGAASLMGTLSGRGVTVFEPFHAWDGRIDGVEAAVVRSVPLGDDFLLLTMADQAPALWSAALAAVASVGGAPVGETALETARVGAGWPRFGRELSEDYIPLEAGLKWAISFDKGCYVGQEVIARMETRGRLAKRLVVIGSVRERGSSENGLTVGAEVRDGDARVGQVTSVAPLAENGVVKALAYVKAGVAEPGRELDVVSRDGALAARVLAVPGSADFFQKLTREGDYQT
jgi:aminomethyltransferase